MGKKHLLKQISCTTLKKTNEIMDTIYEIIEILDKDDKLKINIKNIG